MIATETAPVDRWGFPLTRCTRCGGSGQFGPQSVEGGRCFGCTGTGWTHPRGKVADAARDFAEARRTHRRPIAGAVQPGDIIRRWDTEELRTVAAVEWVSLRRWAGGSRVGTEGTPGFIEASFPAFDVMVTFTDGETVNYGPVNHLIRRAGTPDVAPYLLAAGVTR